MATLNGTMNHEGVTLTVGSGASFRITPTQDGNGLEIEMNHLGADLLVKPEAAAVVRIYPDREFRNGDPWGSRWEGRHEPRD